MSWFEQLRPASWRGVPFEVWHTDGQFGRRFEAHEYPFRDTAWVEDLGGGIRRHSVIGFLVGDDVADQQERMIEAAEREGPGELVHPTLGLMDVTLVSLGTMARYDLGRVVELSFQFLQAGDRQYPSFGLDGVASILDAATAADAAASEDFAARARAALVQGSAVVQQAQKTVRVWTGAAARLSGSARNLLNSVGALVPGADRTFGRFLTGYRSPLAAFDRATNTVNQQVARVNRGRMAVNQAAEDVGDLAGRL